MGKKPTGSTSSGPETQSSKPADVRCCVPACKTPHSRFGFCATHYDEFKFGLITKNGQPAADYDKKIDHYKRFKERQKVGKAA